MSRMIPAAFLAAVCWTQLATAQVAAPGQLSLPGQPPRDSVAAQTGAATIRGHVFDGSTGQPLRKAQVRIQSPELRENRSTTTDSNGAYEFTNLAAGRYRLRVSKSSFIEIAYGQTRPFEAGKPLDVNNAQQLDKIDFSLPRGAVITGRVIDESGEPLDDVEVHAMRSQYLQGRRQLSTVGHPGTTNDIGEFRLYALPPGQYIISATYRSKVDLFDPTGGDRSGYAPTYYPGTPVVVNAQKIAVGVGQKLPDLTITLSPTRMARVSGTAVDSEGRPLANAILMMQASAGPTQSMGTQVRADGAFTLNNVAPGDYTLLVRPNAGGLNGAGAQPSTESVQADISVNGEDITDLRLMGVKPSKLSGRLIPPPSMTNTASLKSALIVASPANPQLVASPALRQPRISDDGAFEMSVMPGKAYIRMNPTGPLASVRIRSVRLNGVDVTDSGIDFRPNEDVSGLEIELTTQLSSISGVVTDARGNAARDYTIVTFARDRDRWGPGSRYMNTGRPDQEGKFKVNLPPGDYYAVALDYVDPGTNTDPEFLERAKERATEFSINEAETKSLNLKLTTGL